MHQKQPACGLFLVHRRVDRSVVVDYDTNMLSAVELQRKRNETYAKWVKEVALLFLAALVVQNIATENEKL